MVIPVLTPASAGARGRLGTLLPLLVWALVLPPSASAQQPPAWGYPPGYGRPQGAYPQPGYPQGAYPQGGYPQGYGAPPQATPYQYRPVPPNNAQGVPPAYQPAPGQARPGQVPGQPPGYGTAWPGTYGQTQAARAAPPRVEWSMDEERPYVQQNVLLRLKLISGESLTKADPEINEASDALIQRLGEPSTRARTGRDGRPETVTEYVLTVTPLRAGTLELPRPKIVGTRPGPYGQSERWEATASSAPVLKVRPAMLSMRPWLPLESLTLNASIDRPEEVRPGQPVTLALELEATGGEATQLPSLEEQLTSPDFRVYREQTLTDTGLSKDGRTLTAKRTEYYTLVPQSGGNLRLPALSVPWWNVETGTREVATLPIKTLDIAGARGPFNLPDSILGASAGWGKVWLPLAAVALVLSGYWIGVLYRRGTPGARAEYGDGRGRGGIRGLVARLGEAGSGALTTAARAAGDGIVRLLGALRPGSLAGRLGGAALSLLPPSSRFLIAVRHANGARDPAAWCERFEQATRRHLRIGGPRGANPPSPNLTERMLGLRPRADRMRLRELMEQLDAARYGRREIDFPRWKREFMRQVGRRRGLLHPPRPDSRIRRAHLPELNPRSA